MRWSASTEPYSRSTLPIAGPHSVSPWRVGRKICILSSQTRSTKALRNAFRHSQARQIEVEIRYDNEQFRLRVRDDGKGMGPAILSSHGSDGHYGLPGMRETATIIGGKLVVWSEVDVGTEVEVRVPASTAYATTRRRSWLVRKFTAKT